VLFPVSVARARKLVPGLMMESMADFTHILATRPDFNNEDREWLHHLVADWQVIADLSFADLLLVLQTGDGHYVVAEQCRPSTVMSLRSEDVVGTRITPSLTAELDAAMESESIYRSNTLRTRGRAVVCDVYAPVKHQGKTLGLVVRETNMATRESNGRYESESIDAGKELFEMIPRGQFPYIDSVLNQRHNARVSDGFIILSAEGIVRYASPNAISCFRRLGSIDTMQGRYLSEIGTSLIRENDPVPESLPLVLSGKAAIDSELDASRSAVSIRSLPLINDSGRIGAVILCRDVTELHRREQELKTKDATISEIHHRVKNNLQAVSALLRLQARRTKLPEVRKELEEAQRRVQTIAVVHEGLSQTADEVVDFDKVISSLLKMSVDLATTQEQHIRISFMGKFGMMPAQDATPLSLVLTELVTNAVEHGFEGRDEGNITISVGRGGNNLSVVVEDDGNGYSSESAGGLARSSGSGLGTQIINTFVTNDFGGSVRWEPRREGGTRVVLNMKLRAAQESAV
jgi:two-component sensor histidine kinase